MHAQQKCQFLAFRSTDTNPNRTIVGSYLLTLQILFVTSISIFSCIYAQIDTKKTQQLAVQTMTHIYSNIDALTTT